MNIFENCKNTKAKGNLGLGEAIAYFVKQGFTVSIPLTDSQDYDLIVDDGEKLSKVQVRTTSFAVSKIRGTYKLNLRVLGGNSKKNFVHKKNSDMKYDLLFALTADGEKYLIPKQSFSNIENNLTLGGNHRKEFKL